MLDTFFDYHPTMPEYSDILSAEKIWAAVSYIRSAWPQAAHDSWKKSVHSPGNPLYP